MATTHVHISEECDLQFPLPELTDDAFFSFCQENKDYRIERTAEGKIEIMPVTGGRTSHRNLELAMQVQLWARADKRGLGFDSNGMFRLPSAAMRAPDVAWIERSRLASISERQKDRFIPLCPDFVIELASPSDRLPTLQAKMCEWMENGCQLGWLIYPPTRSVYVYRGENVEHLDSPDAIDGEGPVAGLRVDLALIWDPGW